MNFYIDITLLIGHGPGSDYIDPVEVVLDHVEPNLWCMICFCYWATGFRKWQIFIKILYLYMNFDIDITLLIGHGPGRDYIDPVRGVSDYFEPNLWCMICFCYWATGFRKWRIFIKILYLYMNFYIDITLLIGHGPGRDYIDPVEVVLDYAESNLWCMIYFCYWATGFRKGRNFIKFFYFYMHFYIDIT